MTHDMQKMDKHPLKEYTVSDLINIDQLQLLMEKFTAVTGVGTAVGDLVGNILVATGWQDICTRFHRKHPETLKLCLESDINLSIQLKKKEKQHSVYHCKNGMVDVAMPIIIDNRHIANLFTGQFFLEEPDIEFFRQQAKKYNFDERQYLYSLSKVSILSNEKLELIIDYLSSFASFLAESGLNKLKLEELMIDLESRVNKRTKELQDSQESVLKMMKETKEANENIMKANKKLEETSIKLRRSNQDLEQFAYVASHDLQEPLRMVSSYVQLLAERYQDKLDEKAQKFISYAVDGAARMQQLIQDLLSFSRINTRKGNFELIDCNQLLSVVLLNLKEVISEKKAIISVDKLPIINGDRIQIAQILQNLISNSIKFCNESQPNVHISSQDIGDFWQISVQDNGIGIQEQYREKIFVIFQRLHTRDEYPGTGIGLAICKRIIERHGGLIRFESKVNEGTTFYITFPKI